MDLNIDTWKVPAEKLRYRASEGLLQFETTDQLPETGDIIGQDRAVKAVEFGLRAGHSAYNIYMAGASGTGKSTYARKVATRFAQQRPPSSDWCYVHNFQEAQKPTALEFPSGGGNVFRKEMEALIKELTKAIPKAFESDEYNQRKSAIVEEFQQKSKAVFEQLEEEAKEMGFALRRTGGGIVPIPLIDGSPVEPDKIVELDPEVREKIEERSREIHKRMAQVMREMRQIERMARDAIAELDKKIVAFVVEPLIQELIEKYQKRPAVVSYLEDVKKDVIENLDDFRDGDDDSPPLPWTRQTPDQMSRYKVNVLVDNSEANGAPVVVETNPNYHNLVGKIEHRHQFGTLVTDFTMIRAGALHRANGGFLIVQMLDLLRNPFAWETLLRTLKTGEARIEDLSERYGISPVATLKPDPIPLDVKVILIGERGIFHLLYDLEPDFRKLFKIKADFDIEMDLTEERLQQYATFIASYCRRENLRHFTRQAVARVVEEGVRLSGDQKKLTTCFNKIVDVITEAALWAEMDDSDYVEEKHVVQAIRERRQRVALLEDKLQEMIDRGHLIVETTGEAVGQVNALAVYDFGDHAFGKPSRVTARSYAGREGIISIERESKLSGRIHDKGVLILSGYLGQKYGQDKPLSLSASICFEQSYSEIEGDSASCAELYALLSSLSGVPLKQSIAVTGSVDQHGKVQPVGGVTQKVEGFFRACKHQGLTGEQGVIIPKLNLDNLVLDDEVVSAVEAGRFHIWAIEDIDQGLEILTGITAGEPDDEGRYPADTIHGKVLARVEEMSEQIREFVGHSREDHSDEA